jgi:serine/threonine protein kinase
MSKPRLIDDRYELDGVVGRGGMAEVYRARDIRLDRVVAVKTLRVRLARDQTFRARFRREAHSAGLLNHPSIVQVYDTGEDLSTLSTEVPIPYIVMEYVDGRTVRELLSEGLRLLPERALEIIRGVLGALDYSHQCGVVHRDIKPSNMMVTRNGDVKVMDFGIARASWDADTATEETTQIIGTVKYMSPEQASRKPVDARSDLYSTGCLLYELLTGRPPFAGNSAAEILHQHVYETAITPSQIDSGLPPWADAITLKAMAKSHDERYQTAAEMRADIERAAGNPEDSYFLLMARPRPDVLRSRPYFATTFGEYMAQTTTVTGDWLAPTAMDLEIRVPSRTDGGSRVVELRGTEGEVSVALAIPDAGRLTRALDRFEMVRRQMHQAEAREAVRDLGALLFSILLPERAKMLYYHYRTASRRLSKHLRLVLRIGPMDLAALPWELMWDEESGIYPCLEHPTVRYVEQVLPAESSQPSVPMRFLGMIATPRDLPQLQAEDERTAVEAALSTLTGLGQVKLDWVHGESWDDLRRKLYKRQYDAFHFIGHGGFSPNLGEGFLAFTAHDGTADKVSSTELAVAFAGQHRLKLAVLNSCESGRSDGKNGYTSVAEALVRHGLAAVLAMQNPVSDPIAVQFATHFYDGLSMLMPIDFAALHARQGVRRQHTGLVEWGNPVVYLRSHDQAHLLGNPAYYRP